VLDWRKLVRARAWEVDWMNNKQDYYKIPNARCNFDELRTFFKSEWCDFLLSVNHVSTTSGAILKQLESELEEAKKKIERRAR